MVRVCGVMAVVVALNGALLFAGEGSGAGVFTPFDTAHLMGSPETHPSFGVERAFEKLKFKRPVEFTFAPDGSGRVFVVEQDGRIHVFPNDPNVEKTTVFLDISKSVRRDHNEEGLLGLAFHPQFKENGFFFVFYNVTPMGSVLSRFRASKNNPDVAEADSETKLLEYTKPYGNHNGGSIKFGPDGFLYLGIGDGGSGNDPHGNGQNLETVLGKILRIDVNKEEGGKKYAIPADNPFVGKGEKVRGEIWAYGLRNPWRISFDRKSGTMWCADVGQDAFEEVNIIKRGGNYGWKLREGKHARDEKSPGTPADYVEPLVEYPREEGKSITGGVVYRGKRVAGLEGAYVYADFISGNFWALRDEKPVAKGEKIVRSSLMISAFGEDEAGEAYMTAFDGNIYRFKAAPNTPAAEFPKTLSATKLFASTQEHTPAAGLIPYSVNVPLWSDGADKLRYLALPKNASIAFKDSLQWELPIGAVIVKTFELPLDAAHPEKKVRLETRLWMHTPRGWDGVTYIWNDDQSDATLQEDAAFRKEFEIKTAKGPETREWYFPSRSDCHACHTQNGGFVLGWNTRQFNRVHEQTKQNQIKLFADMNLFSAPPPADPAAWQKYPRWEERDAAPVEVAARAYLDANCSMCHSPGGPGNAGGSSADVRFHTPHAQAFPPPSRPDAAPWIKPGDPAGSMLLTRMSVRDRKRQMPPLATHVVDADAVQLLKKWIAEMPVK